MDISEKAVLRKSFEHFRLSLSPDMKKNADREITISFLTTKQYYDTDIILTYFSKESEIDTRGLITAALANGKKVACPRCVGGTNEMEFYYINSFSDLTSGVFGIREPNPQLCERVPDSDFAKSVCVVPGLGFDMEGYRIGFGKGFYDRFLSDYNGTAVGFCYSRCVKLRLPRQEHDRNVELIVTEKYIRNITRK